MIQNILDDRSWNTGTYTISEAVTIPSSHQQTVSDDSSKEQRVEIVEVLLVPGGGPLLPLLLQTIMTLSWCPHYTALITPWSADRKRRSVYSTGCATTVKKNML